MMSKKKIALLVTFILILSSFLGLSEAYAGKLDPYYCDVYGTYGVRNADTGVTAVNIHDSRIDSAEMSVEVITSGEFFDKYAELFEGDIIIYNVQVTYEGTVLENINFGSMARIIFPDEERNVYRTADVFKVNKDGTITDIIDGRHFLEDANTARLSEFGYFLLAKGKIKDSSILVIPTAIPTATPEVSETITPTSTPDEPDYLIGDVDLDGKVNATDALIVLKHAAKLELLEDIKLIIADVESDEKIDAADALAILKIAAKIE